MKYIVLSFDDGKKDFYTCAFKILQKYNLPAVLNVVSDYATTKESEYVSWNEIRECQKGGIEIANHSANHTNALADIIRSAKQIQAQLDTIEKIGFASPNSEVCEKNFGQYKDLLDSDHTAYVRSGNQLKRDGYFHALLYLLYKYTGWNKIFFWYNRRNVIQLNKQRIKFFPSVTCNRDNTMQQIMYFIEKMPDYSACVIMLHCILEKDIYQGVKWSNSIEDFESLCKYLSQNKDVSVINHKKLCEIINNAESKK